MKSSGAPPTYLHHLASLLPRKKRFFRKLWGNRAAVASAAPIEWPRNPRNPRTPTPGLWFPSPNLLLVFVVSVGDPHGGGRETQIQGWVRGSVISVSSVATRIGRDGQH